jgi:hypothetical protein
MGEESSVTFSAEDLGNLYKELGELRTRVAHIETSLETLQKISDQLDTFLKQGQGVLTLLRFLFYIIGPAVAAIYWIKEHVK